MDYSVFVRTAVAQNPLNKFDAWDGSLAGVPKELHPYYRTCNPVKVEVLLDDVPIQFVAAKSLIATTQTYSYINASLVFATCNGDPIFWDKGKIYTCAHGVKNPNWEYISPSFDDFLTSLY